MISRRLFAAGFCTVMFIGMAVAQEGAPPGAPKPPESGVRDSAPAPNPVVGPGPLMRALDADQDGALSARELANAPAALATLDANKDGRLTRDELRPPGGRGLGRRGAALPPGPRTRDAGPRARALEPPGRDIGPGPDDRPFARRRLRLHVDGDRPIPPGPPGRPGMGAGRGPGRGWGAGGFRELGPRGGGFGRRGEGFGMRGPQGLDRQRGFGEPRGPGGRDRPGRPFRPEGPDGLRGPRGPMPPDGPGGPPRAWDRDHPDRPQAPRGNAAGPDDRDGPRDRPDARGPGPGRPLGPPPGRPRPGPDLGT
ncbi:MAG: hypothetical protein HRF43_06815 [Phycisphaerae bacterium]